MNEYIQDIIFELSFKFDLSDSGEKILEKAIRRTYNRGVEDSLKSIIREYQNAELDGKGYDFYFAIRNKIDNINKLLGKKEWSKNITNSEVAQGLKKILDNK